jgi:alkanesulfonate monooxygenase SsuD/methylene tetrahydromethanopterin reductase-like flavin-dependent oxidoreductase (luciferase family)
LLWTQPLVNFEGSWHHIPDAGLNPLPVQRPIPIWFGGSDERVLQRMARLGDGWIINQRSIEQARPKLDALLHYLQEAGRARSSFGIEPRLNMNLVGQDGWTSFIRAWEELEASHLMVNTMGCGFETISAHIQALKHFADTVGLKK